jgi:SAM-dependent methyltransferase
MADGRDVPVWDKHAQECREAKRTLFEFNPEDDNTGGWLRKKVIELLPPLSEVVDLGCGPGYWNKLFGGMKYTGLDQSSEMLKLAAELSPGLGWVQGNARASSVSFPTGSIDMVFTASVLQHNRHEPDKSDIVKEAYKIVREGGYFLCSENTYRKDNCPQSASNPEYTDGYSFTPAGWEKFMLPLGFKLLDFNGQSEYVYKRI